jgi:hypothetical protein
MKNKRQYRDSAMFTFIGYIGIILVVFATLIGVGEYTGFNQEVREGLQDDPRPLTPLINYMHPDSWGVDTLTQQDSLEIKDPDMMYLDTPDLYDGNEYQIRTYEDSEEDLDYYNSDEYMELWYTQIDTNSNGTPDDIERWDSTLQKWVLKDDFEWGDQGPCGDEYKMWIGENGDTIWE